MCVWSPPVATSPIPSIKRRGAESAENSAEYFLTLCDLRALCASAFITASERPQRLLNKITLKILVIWEIVFIFASTDRYAEARSWAERGG